MTDAASNCVPFVSVIVPTHGRRALLLRLLESLLAQNWPADRYEIIVVHNYSADGTEEAVAALAAGARAPIYYHQKNFPGPGLSRQFGADQANGRVLAFIDDDCRATPGWIAAGVAAIGSGAALAQGRTMADPAQPRRMLDKTVTVSGPTPFFETCNIFYDTAAFRAVGGFPPAFRSHLGGEDTSLGWALKSAGYTTGFAADAVVHHEVFAVSYWTWIREVRVAARLPALARAYPALRRHLFLRCFLSRETAAFNLLLVGVVLSVLVHPAFLALTMPYILLRLLDAKRFRGPHILVARLVFGMPRAAAMTAVLLWQSMRARSVVL